ncbi:MAG: FliA/WhiG family RNA polymerase sigma factor [Bryobacterales bacterium]|nr:FliA/WhiG family RNA polymerase sigma factor [Bryobacterales bacterium]
MARDQRILDNIHLVKIIAIRVYEGLPVHIELEELVQVGVMGLLEAAEKFDESKNVTFAAYAKHRIRGAILDSLRQMDWASRDQRRRVRQMEAAVHNLSGALCRTPSAAEIATEMGMDLVRWQRMLSELQGGVSVSASSRPPGQEDGPPPDFPADTNDHPDAICKRNQLAVLLKEVLQSLPPRYQEVVRMYYTEELTMKEIGLRMGVNESRVSQIHKAALRKMATYFTAAGIDASAVL